jgi:hypothetical protein
MFYHRQGKVYEIFETMHGHSFVLVEDDPDERPIADAVLAQWGIVGYRVEEIDIGQL